MLRRYLITAAYITKGSVKYYYHPRDSENAAVLLLRSNIPFITVAVDAMSLRQARLLAKEALAKEMSDG